ncbi:MAG: hypothetical protein LBS77_05350 [Desulfovibrio sp.]|nr:hypothetical protein [Desulfovibrio sp.]
MYKKLNTIGIPVGTRHLLSPTAPLVEHLRAVGGIRRIYLVGNEDYRAAMTDLSRMSAVFMDLYEKATWRRPEHIFGKPEPAVHRLCFHGIPESTWS